MKITVTPQRFEKDWKSTGQMIQESPTMFVQTYSRKGIEGRFKQAGKENSPFGKLIILEQVKL